MGACALRRLEAYLAGAQPQSWGSRSNRPGRKDYIFEEALVDGPPGRVSELMDIWHADRDGLLNLAVRHELGHALCNDENERKADHVARLLEQKKPTACEGKTSAKQKSSDRASSN